MKKTTLPPMINYCFLMLSEQCNLRCKYCYIQGRDNPYTIDISVMEKIKKMFTCYNKPRIIFFGGEPLLRVNLIKEIVKKYKDDFQYQVVTNGTVNFNEFMDEVYQPFNHIFDVQISWDGNIDTRKSVTNKITNNIVYDNIITQLKKGYRLEGRCVLDETSVKNFFETYKIFKDLHHTYKFSGDFTIAHQPQFKESYWNDLEVQLNLIFSDIKNNLVNDNKIYIPRFLYKNITNVIENKPVISCDVGNYVVIRPNGDIYPCTILSQIDERFKMGNINDEIDTEIIDDLKYKSSCKKECKYKSICDGGCRYERIKNFSNSWKENICPFTCEIYKVIYECTNKFLNSLDADQQNKLYELITQYNLWSIDYCNCSSKLNKDDGMIKLNV